MVLFSLGVFIEDTFTNLEWWTSSIFSHVSSTSFLDIFGHGKLSMCVFGCKNVDILEPDFSFISVVFLESFLYDKFN